jgi:hypothetical protein
MACLHRVQRYQTLDGWFSTAPIISNLLGRSQWMQRWVMDFPLAILTLQNFVGRREREEQA